MTQHSRDPFDGSQSLLLILYEGLYYHCHVTKQNTIFMPKITVLQNNFVTKPQLHIVVCCPKTMGKFPCRYKKCNGAVHSGKCPVASSRGKKGGKTTGDSKKRMGDSNGRFKHGYRDCCNTLKTSPHDINCSKANMMLRKEIRAKTNFSTPIPQISISWAKDAIAIEPISFMLRGIEGQCPCGITMPAIKAVKVHPKDINSNPARVICGACL
mgnify:CR=1 FL=1